MGQVLKKKKQLTSRSLKKSLESARLKIISSIHRPRDTAFEESWFTQRETHTSSGLTLVLRNHAAHFCYRVKCSCEHFLHLLFGTYLEVLLSFFISLWLLEPKLQPINAPTDFPSIKCVSQRGCAVSWGMCSVHTAQWGNRIPPPPPRTQWKALISLSTRHHMLFNTFEWKKTGL